MSCAKIKYQVVYPIVDLTDEINQKIRKIPAGTSITIGPFLASGYAQLVGSLLADTATRLQIQGSALPVVGTWSDLYDVTLVASVLEQFVVDLTTDYIQLIITAPAAPPAETNIELSGNLYPIEALESNRSAASPDVVEIKLGLNGTVGRGTLVAGAAAVEVIPFNGNRKSATLRNWGTRTLYWGYTAAEATAAAGFPLDPKESYTWKETQKEIYAFAPAGVNIPWASDQQLK
jgi:hypothetical protein